MSVLLREYCGTFTGVLHYFAGSTAANRGWQSIWWMRDKSKEPDEEPIPYYTALSFKLR